MSTTTNKQTLTEALEDFKRATAALNKAWSEPSFDGDEIANYPRCLPSFDEFVPLVMEMHVKTLELPILPAAGTILRARFDLDGGGHFRWPKGWAGEMVDISSDHIRVRAHRYLGPGAHEWDNCRVLSIEDGAYEFENRFGYAPGDEITLESLLALALDREFEES